MGEETQMQAAGETTTQAIVINAARAGAGGEDQARPEPGPVSLTPLPSLQQSYQQLHQEDEHELQDNPVVDSDPISDCNVYPSSSKIPFRPRKVRKVSSASQEEDSNKDSENAISGNYGHNLVVVKSRKSVPPPPPFFARTISSAGEVELAIRHLRSSDPLLAPVIDENQTPVFHNIHPPFHSLARSILYQQLAFKAAASVYSRFISLCGGEDGVVPEAVLGLTQQQLRQIGVSTRKASYLHDLASKYSRGILSDAAIVSMDDKSLFSMLTMVKGIGAWSVHMFMIFSLHRPDVLPVGDLGVRKGVQLLYGLEDLPRPSQMEQLCERWRPYRSVGSWYMWRLVEKKGAPMTPVAAGAQQQFLDPVNALANLG